MNWTGKGILWDWVDESIRVPWWYGWASTDPFRLRDLVIVMPFNWLWAVGEWFYLAIRICLVVRKTKNLQRKNEEFRVKVAELGVENIYQMGKILEASSIFRFDGMTFRFDEMTLDQAEDYGVGDEYRKWRDTQGN